MKRALKILLYLIGTCMVLWYAAGQFVQYNKITNANFAGESLGNIAMNIGLGGDVFFTEKAADFDKALIKDVCGGLTLRECFGISAWKKPAMQAYYQECGFLWGENCIVFSVNEKLKEKAELLDLVKKVVLNPCNFLPTQEEIEVKKSDVSKSNIFLEKFPDPQLSYLAARRDLSCDSQEIKKTKIIIAIYDQANEEHIDTIVVKK